VKDTRQVPYHLPDLIKGVAAGRRIFITEGEKDADNLRSLGFVATTNPGGAKKWRQDFSAFFTGSNVVVVADNDEAGRLHVDEIAASLHGIAAEVRVLDIKAYWPECGPKGDISDWIAASANDPDDFAGKLKEAVKALVPWTPPSNNGRSTAAATIDSSFAGQRGAAMSGSWPDPKPLPCGLPPVDDFSSDFMPSALAPWVDDIATRLQCPPDYVAVAAITALGSTIGRRLGIKPQIKTDWVEIPNLWGAFIGRPGMLKSPTMNEALRPLYHLEHEAAEANDLARQTYAADLEAYKIRQQVRISQAKDALRKDPSGSVDGLTIGDEPQEPPNVRYRTNDSSYDSLGELQISNPNGILVERDELISLLKSLERDDQTVARGFYLSGWSGTQPYTFDRIARGHRHIPAICISVLGNTQPARISEYVRRVNLEGAGGDGLIQRFGLLVWPDASPEWKNIDEYPDSEARETVWKIFKRLGQIDIAAALALGATKGEFDKVPSLRFDEAAHSDFLEWRKDLEQRLRSGELSPALEGHSAKYQKLVPSPNR
jgi:hypothetical protein